MVWLLIHGTVKVKNKNLHAGQRLSSLCDDFWFEGDTDVRMVSLIPPINRSTVVHHVREQPMPKTQA